MIPSSNSSLQRLVKDTAMDQSLPTRPLMSVSTYTSNKPLTNDLSSSSSSYVSSSSSAVPTVPYGYAAHTGGRNNTITQGIPPNPPMNTMILPRGSYVPTTVPSQSMRSSYPLSSSTSSGNGSRGTASLPPGNYSTIASLPTTLSHHTLSNTNNNTTTNTTTQYFHHQPVHIEKPDKPLRARTAMTITPSRGSSSSSTDKNTNTVDMSLYHPSILSSSSSGSGSIPLLARSMDNPLSFSSSSSFSTDLSLLTLLNDEQRYHHHHQQPPQPQPQPQYSPSSSPNRLFYPTITARSTGTMHEAITAATVVLDSITNLQKQKQKDNHPPTSVADTPPPSAAQVLTNLSLSQLSSHHSMPNNDTTNPVMKSSSSSIPPPLSVLEQLSIGFHHTDSEFIHGTSSSSSFLPTVDTNTSLKQRVNRQRKRNPLASLLPEFTEKSNTKGTPIPPSSATGTNLTAPSPPSATTTTTSDTTKRIPPPPITTNNKDNDDSDSSDDDDSMQYTLPASFLSPAQLAANQQSRLHRLHQPPPPSAVVSSESHTVSTFSSVRSSPLSSTASSSPVMNTSIPRDPLPVPSPPKSTNVPFVPRPPPVKSATTAPPNLSASSLVLRPPPPRNSTNASPPVVTESITTITNDTVSVDESIVSSVLPGVSTTPTDTQALSAHLSLVVAHQTKLENELKATQARLALYESSSTDISSSSSSSFVLPSTVPNPFHTLSSSSVPSPASTVPSIVGFTNDSNATTATNVTPVTIARESSRTMDELSRLTDELNKVERSPPFFSSSMSRSSSRPSSPVHSTVPTVVTTNSLPSTSTTTPLYGTGNQLLQVSSRLPSVALSPQARTISAHVVHRLQSQVTSLTKQIQELTKDTETEKQKVFELSKEKHTLYEQLVHEQEKSKELATTLDQTRATLDHQTTVIQGYDQEKQSLTQRIQELETFLRDNKALSLTEQERLQALLVTQQERTKASEEQQQRTTEENRQLKEQLQQRENEWRTNQSVSGIEVQQLKEQYNASTDAYRTLEIRYRDLETRYQSMVTERSTWEQRTNDYQQQLSLLQGKENHLQQQLIESNSRYTEYVAQAETNAKMERIRTEEMADELSETKQEAEALRIRLGEITRNRQQDQETYQQQIETLKNELRANQETLNVKSLTLEDVSSKLAVYESEDGVRVTKAEAEQYREWQEKYPRLVTESKEYETRLQEKDKIIQGLKDEIGTVRTNKEEIIKDKINLESTIITLRKRIQTLEQTIDNDRKEHETKTNEWKNDMETIHAMYTARIEALETKYRTETEQTVTRTKEEETRLRNEIASLQESLRNLPPPPPDNTETLTTEIVSLRAKLQELHDTQIDDRDTISELMGALDAAKVRRNEWERRALHAEEKVRELQATVTEKERTEEELRNKNRAFETTEATHEQTLHRTMEEYDTQRKQYLIDIEQLKETLRGKENTIIELHSRIDTLSTVTPPRKPVVPMEIQTSPLPQTTLFPTPSRVQAAVQALDDVPRLEAMILALKTELLDLRHAREKEKMLLTSMEVAQNETLAKLKLAETNEQSARAAQQAAAETLQAVRTEYEQKISTLQQSVTKGVPSASAELTLLQSRLDSAMALSDTLRKKLDEKERMLSTAATVADKAAAAAEAAEATVDYAYTTANKQIETLRNYYDSKLSTYGITVTESEIQRVLQEAIQSVPPLASIDSSHSLRTPFPSSVRTDRHRSYYPFFSQEDNSTIDVTHHSVNILSVLSGISGDPRTPLDDPTVNDPRMRTTTSIDRTTEDQFSLSRTLPTPMHPGNNHERMLPLSTESNGTARYGYGFHHTHTPSVGPNEGTLLHAPSSTTSSHHRLTPTVRSLGDTLTSFAVTPASVGNQSNLTSYSNEKDTGTVNTSSVLTKPIFVSPVTPVMITPYDTQTISEGNIRSHPIITVSDTGTTPLGPSSSPLLSLYPSNSNHTQGNDRLTNMLSPESPRYMNHTSSTYVPHFLTDHSPRTSNSMQKGSLTPLPPSPKHRSVTASVTITTSVPAVTESQSGNDTTSRAPSVPETIVKNNLSGGGTGETASTTVAVSENLLGPSSSAVSSSSVLLPPSLGINESPLSSPPDSPRTASTVSSLPSSPILSSLIYGTYSRIHELELPVASADNLGSSNYRNEFASPSTPSRTSNSNSSSTMMNDFSRGNYLTLEALALATLSPSSSSPGSNNVPLLESPPPIPTNRSNTTSTGNHHPTVTVPLAFSAISSSSSSSSVLVSPTTAMDNILTLANNAQLDSTETAKLLQAILGLQSPPPVSSASASSTRSATETAVPSTSSTSSNPLPPPRGLESPPSPVTYPSTARTSRSFAAALVNQSMVPSSSPTYYAQNSTVRSPHRRPTNGITMTNNHSSSSTRAVRFADEVEK